MPNFDGLTEEEQIEKMREWFHENYEDPAERTPYEGEYIWIYGGPYDAYEVLSEEFEGIVEDALLQELAGELNSISVYWTSTSDEDFYEDFTPLDTLLHSIDKVKNLSRLDIPILLRLNYYYLLYVNCIAIMEVYLSDTFINNIMNDQVKKKGYVRLDSYFKEIKFSKIYAEYDKIDDAIKDHLLNTVWHKLPKVNDLYKGVLEIDFESFIPKLIPKIEQRHHIVHRNGKDKEGVDISIELAQIEELIRLVVELANYIEEQLNQHDCPINQHECPTEY